MFSAAEIVKNIPLVPLFEFASHEIQNKWNSYNDENHLEMLQLGRIWQSQCNTAQSQDPTQKLNLNNQAQNNNLPCHLQYDQKQRIPLLFSQGFRPEPNAAAWKKFIKGNDLTHIIFDIIGYICEYQLLRQNEAKSYCLFHVGFSYDPTNLFFEEFKTWLCLMSKHESHDINFSSEVDRHINYLIQIINSKDIFTKIEKNAFGDPINPQRKQVIVYIKNKLQAIKIILELNQSRHSAREQFQILKMKAKNFIYDVLYILFYDQCNIQLPESFILSELAKPKLESYIKLNNFTFFKLFQEFVNSKLIKQVFNLEDDDENEIFKIINPFLNNDNEVIFPENIKNLNLNSNNWCYPTQQIKSGVLPYFPHNNNLFPKLFLTKLNYLYIIDHFYLICDSMFEFSGDGGDILVYGYMGKKVLNCIAQFTKILSQLMRQLQDFCFVTQDLSERINTQQQIPAQLLKGKENWQINHEKAHIVWVQLQVNHNEINELVTEIEKKIRICNTHEYKQLIQQKLNFFNRLTKSFLQNAELEKNLIDESLIVIGQKQNENTTSEFVLLESDQLNKNHLKEIDCKNAIEFIERQDFPSALEFYVNLALKYPDNPTIESQQLFCLMLCEDCSYKNAYYAMKSINRIIAKYPQELEPKYIKAKLEHHFCFFNDSKKTLDEILENNPQDQTAWSLKRKVLEDTANFNSYKCIGS